jgi:hypothetical protein
MMTEMKFEAFLPQFSGFSSVEWASLVSDPQHRAAQQYAKENATEGGLNAEDYMKILEQMAVSEKQRSLLAQKYTQSFAIELAYSMCSPNGLLFDRYDYDADRIVVTIPIWSIRRLIMLFKLDNLAPAGRIILACGDRLPEARHKPARQCPVLHPREIGYKCIRHNLSQLLLVLLAPLLANGRVRR